MGGEHPRQCIRKGEKEKNSHTYFSPPLHYPKGLQWKDGCEDCQWVGQMMPELSWADLAQGLEALLTVVYVMQGCRQSVMI